ncbi:MAG: aldolase/citrate lyase family protein, partial [Desulfovibrio fairfieldensis]
LNSLGWQVEPEPVETLSLTLPKELEEPYLSYNVLQRAQGFDLEPCCGKTVERCTYTVKNHPSGKVCQADLYICGGEIVAGAGYDWMLLDVEHAPGSPATLLPQLQAAAAFPAVPVVRLPMSDRVWCKWALDLGASGIMFPNIDNAAQAEEAVSFMQYPPCGVRGVGQAVRASDYGREFRRYAACAQRELLGVMQIESPEAVGQCSAIAAVRGVDVLFVEPVDLGVSMEMPENFADPRFMAALRGIADAARGRGKAAGILLPTPDLAPAVREMGYTFISVGSDAALLAQALADNLKALWGSEK